MPPTCRRTAARWGSTRRRSGRRRAIRARGRRASRRPKPPAGARPTSSVGFGQDNEGDGHMPVNYVVRDLPRRGGRFGLVAVVIAAVILFLVGGPFRTVPAGNVGVKDLFGPVSHNVLTPGLNIAVPLTR